MIIEKIQVENFKRVSKISVELNDITYLVGGNNSGKSSVLQAVHMAISCAQRANELQQRVIAESSLRYCPTGDFLRLGNTGPYENRRDGSRGIMDFYGKTAAGADASYKIEIYKARNYHNVGVDRSGVYPGFGQFICDPASLFSVYVPGLAGIPHKEEMQNYASVFKKAAGGEANFVFRNIIRLIAERNQLPELEALLFDVIGPCRFRVDFNQDRDLYVDVKVSFSEVPTVESFVPMDLSGTGVIQITQILAYVILFRPRLLLIDEPDSHLHPSRQALLSSVFSTIVQKFDCRIIVSTHSRHLVSSAPAEAKLVWLRNGQVEIQEDNGLAAMLLDLGALDQIDSKGAETLICTEDTGKKQLEDCLATLSTSKTSNVISYHGVTNAASAAIIKAMSELFSKKPQVIIHRDRDFLTEEEVKMWSIDFESRGIRVFCPILPDIESYYISSDHVSEVYEICLDEASARLKEINAEIESKMRSKFKEKRRQAIQKFWRDGGAPLTNDLWPAEEPMIPSRMLGKDIVPKINEKFSQLYGVRKNLFRVPSQALCIEIEKFLAEN